MPKQNRHIYNNLDPKYWTFCSYYCESVTYMSILHVIFCKCMECTSVLLFLSDPTRSPPRNFMKQWKGIVGLGIWVTQRVIHHTEVEDWVCRSIFQFNSFCKGRRRGLVKRPSSQFVILTCHLHIKYGDSLCSSACSDTLEQTEQKLMAHCDWKENESHIALQLLLVGQETDTRRQHLSGKGITNRRVRDKLSLLLVTTQRKVYFGQNGPKYTVFLLCQKQLTQEKRTALFLFT